MMETLFFQFDYSDVDLAEFMFKSILPRGVRRARSAVVLKSPAGGRGGFLAELAIEVSPVVAEAGRTHLVNWFYDCCKQCGKKAGRINGRKIVYNERSLRRVIENEIKAYGEREARRILKARRLRKAQERILEALRRKRRAQRRKREALRLKVKKRPARKRR
jgi:hypothetical protein